MLLTCLGLYLASLLRRTLPLGLGGALPYELVAVPWPVYIAAILTWGSALVLSGAYDHQRVLRWYSEVTRVAWASLIATVLLAGTLFMSFRETSRLQFLYFLAINLGLLLGYRALLRMYYRLVGRARPGRRSRILVLGAGDLGRRVADVILDHSRWGFDLVGFLDDDSSKFGQSWAGAEILGDLDTVQNVVEDRDVEEVWIALPARAYDRLNDIIAKLERMPVRIKIIPDYFSLALIEADAEILGGIPVIGLREPVIDGVPRLIKRVFDFVMSILLLVLTAPIAILTVLVIRLDSPGPVIFRQQRVGENGRLFDMLKFRTMVREAEEESRELAHRIQVGELIHKRKDDPRVTRIGKLLRRYSLDELPQLLNVLRGDMSLVGPRPEMPVLVDQYKLWQRKRFAVPQGLTGWWQINGRSDKPMHLNTEDDLYYVYNYSLWLDIKILLRTPFAVLRGQGAF